MDCEGTTVGSFELLIIMWFGGTDMSSNGDGLSVSPTIDLVNATQGRFQALGLEDRVLATDSVLGRPWTYTLGAIGSTM